QSNLSGLVVATADGELVIEQIAAPDGTPAVLPQLDAGSVLPLLPAAAASEITRQFQQSLRAEGRRLSIYSEGTALQLPEHLEPSGQNANSGYASVAVDMPAFSPQDASADNVTFLLGAFAAFWHRKGAPPRYRLDAYFPAGHSLDGFFRS